MGQIVLLCLLLALPAGWFAGVLVDRIPDALPLSRPLPGITVDALHLGIVALTAGLFALAGWRFADAPTGELVAVLVFSTSVVALSVIDVRELRLPDRITGPTYLILLVMIVWVSIAEQQPERIRFALLGGFVWVVLLGIGWLVGMGFGDVKAGGVYGMMVGWMAGSATEALSLVMWSLIVGTLLASAYGLTAKVVQTFRVPAGERGRQWFAFGPFLAVGAVVVVLFADAFLPAT